MRGLEVLFNKHWSLGVDPKSVVANEFSTHAISALERLGVRAESVDFRGGVPGGPFRVIVLFQTLEHLDRLDNVIQSLDNLATHDANLFLSVPNVEYLEWAELNIGGVDMPPNHINGFSLEGLIKHFLIMVGICMILICTQEHLLFLDAILVP